MKKHNLNVFFKRAFHLLQRVIRESKVFPQNYRSFGFKIAWAIWIDGLIPPGKSNKYIETISEYISAYLQPIVEKYQVEPFVESESMITTFEKTPVWCCWWQGENNMPELVRLCNMRLREVLPSNAELHMITWDNYEEYVQFPDYIINKYNEGKMTMTALSDILRVSLLCKYGGFWIDSTVFISNQLPQEFLTRDFYTQKMFDPIKWKREACKGRWCGFMMSGSANHIIFRFLQDAFYQWWKDYDCIIDYVIIDYFLLTAYRKIPCVRKIIDKMPDNNVDMFEMYKVLNLPFTPELYQSLTQGTTMHKLTYKIDVEKETPNGEKTLYAYLLEMVGL